MDLLETVVHSDAEDISPYLMSRKRIQVSGTSSDESNWEEKSHESFDVSGEILKFSLQTRELLGDY